MAVKSVKLSPTSTNNSASNTSPPMAVPLPSLDLVSAYLPHVQVLLSTLPSCPTISYEHSTHPAKAWTFIQNFRKVTKFLASSPSSFPEISRPLLTSTFRWLYPTSPWSINHINHDYLVRFTRPGDAPHSYSGISITEVQADQTLDPAALTHDDITAIASMLQRGVLHGPYHISNIDRPTLTSLLSPYPHVEIHSTGSHSHTIL